MSALKLWATILNSNDRIRANISSTNLLIMDTRSEADDPEKVSSSWENCSGNVVCDDNSYRTRCFGRGIAACGYRESNQSDAGSAFSPVNEIKGREATGKRSLAEKEFCGWPDSSP